MEKGEDRKNGIGIGDREWEGTKRVQQPWKKLMVIIMSKRR